MIRSILAAAAAVVLVCSAAMAASDVPFKTKSVLNIPVSGMYMDDNHGEMVAVTGTITGKLQIAYKGKATVALSIKVAAAEMTGTGMTSGNVYEYKGKFGYKAAIGTTIGAIDLEIQAMEGDPIPGLDVKLGKNPGGALVAVHVDVDPTGQVTGTSATLGALPTPASNAPITLLSITN